MPRRIICHVGGHRAGQHLILCSPCTRDAAVCEHALENAYKTQRAGRVASYVREPHECVAPVSHLDVTNNMSGGGGHFGPLHEDKHCPKQPKTSTP